MEPLTVDRWLYNTLTADAELMALVTGVYSLPAPSSAVLPYVVYQEQASADIRGVGPHRIGISGTWLVRGVAKTSSWAGVIDDIAERVDTLLQAGSGSAQGGVIWACVRERPFRLVENVTSGQFRHNGGQYRIWAT
jgi:hypothetical protein